MEILAFPNAASHISSVASLEKTDDSWLKRLFFVHCSFSRDDLNRFRFRCNAAGGRPSHLYSPLRFSIF